MKPIGLTFKKEGEGRIGEVMLVHQCMQCGKISINRIAADDSTDEIMRVFETSRMMDETVKDILTEQEITLLGEHDEKELKIQLFGN